MAEVSISSRNLEKMLRIASLSAEDICNMSAACAGGGQMSVFLTTADSNGDSNGSDHWLTGATGDSA
jgi:hypothetical protein